MSEQAIKRSTTAPATTHCDCHRRRSSALMSCELGPRGLNLRATPLGDLFLRRRRALVIAESIFSSVRRLPSFSREDFTAGDPLLCPSIPSSVPARRPAEETALLDQLGNLRRDHLLPRLVACRDPLQDVARREGRPFSSRGQFSIRAVSGESNRGDLD